ncbi:ABC transporter transmembrane domain-containing protein [Actinomycetospora lutea]|uniref:ABC transporter transmembrane domain-containing protein n=1 Tax=Actinomycetospora lutea TaxID=663604 RepID=UPI002365F0ED|nr:ABC transporter transmembrane domain-containing protein [Actinomycetospora lutea]MDD7940443.1 ABC transporter transmembrane domain-containing protein [Actinomycetospora lutea]
MTDADRRGAGPPGRELLPVAGARAVRIALGRLLRGRRGVLAVGLGALVASAVAGVLVPPLLGQIVDVVVDRRGADAVTGPVLGLAGAALAQGLLAVVGMAAVARAGEEVLADLREAFVARALGLPLARLERAGAGDLTSRVTADLALVGEAVRQAVPDMARGALVIVLSLGGLAVLDPRFLLAALVAVPVQVLTARWYVRRSSPLYREQREVGGAQQQQLLDTAGGIATVRALDLHDDHTERVRSRAQDVVDLALRVVRLQTGFFGRLNLAEYLGVAAVLAAGFALVGADAATVGGHTPTAAQAQQLALARLVLADPAVAVLDEATAEAGSAGARVLEAAADRALRGRTALVVAHRLTQAAAADAIAVLDAGVLVEHGTHEELLAADGRYAELWAAARLDR